MKQIHIIICLTIFLFINIGCSSHYVIKDIMNIPQSNTAHLPDKKIHYKHVTKEFHGILNDAYNKRWFSPWDKEAAGYEKKSVLWGFNRYRKKLGYGENDIKHTEDWIDDLLDNANFDNYPNKNVKAITVVNTNLRVLPTSKPHFYSKKRLGQGFPFDNLQNSSVFANTPIFISHISKDRAWVLAESPFALGWIPTNDIAYVDDEFIESWIKDESVAIIKERVHIYDSNDSFLFNASIGAHFPLVSEVLTGTKIDYLTINDYVKSFEYYDKYIDKLVLLDVHTFPIPKGVIKKIKSKKKEEIKDYDIFVAVKDSSGMAKIEIVKISKEVSVLKPLILTKSNVALISDLLIGSPYGWGGMFYNRDCSAMLRDLFAPFSIWLPRNSRYQAKYGGTYISFKNVSRKKKKEIISKNAIPYLTLVHLNGHIMLYIGTKNSEPLIFHNVWGLRYTPFLRKKKLYTIGKAVITTLNPGSSLPGSKPLIDRVTGITLLVPSKKY